MKPPKLHFELRKAFRIFTSCLDTYSMLLGIICIRFHSFLVDRSPSHVVAVTYARVPTVSGHEASLLVIAGRLGSDLGGASPVIWA